MVFRFVERTKKFASLVGKSAANSCARKSGGETFRARFGCAMRRSGRILRRCCSWLGGDGRAADEVGFVHEGADDAVFTLALAIDT